MTSVSLATRSFRVAPGPAGSEDVVLDTLMSTVDARALSTALGWMRTRDFHVPDMDSAEQVLAFRALASLVDQLDAVTDGGAPLTLRQPDVLLLAQAANAYVAERDVEGYVDPRERERIGRLRVLGERLFDAVADFAGAVEEVAAHTAR